MIYIDKIISHTYSCMDVNTKDELHQVGLIGLWRGITAYYKKDPVCVVQKEFIDTICAYIRYEMADLFKQLNGIKISANQWRNYVQVQKIINENMDCLMQRLQAQISDAGLNYDWYLKTENAVHIASLDATIGEDNKTNRYRNLYQNDYNIDRFFDQAYIDYVINSAFAGIKLGRDRQLIQSWIGSICDGRELTQTQLAKQYGISPSTAGVILNRFIDICRFVRDCESDFHNDPNGIIHFPRIKAPHIFREEKKVPGIRWVMRNNKWKVEITIGKRGSVFIGYFQQYQDAIRARRDAEIKYRGKSDITL